jgi:transketolase
VGPGGAGSSSDVMTPGPISGSELFELDDATIERLELTANAMRESIISMLLAAGSGHTAGPLGMADIFAYLFMHALRHQPSNPAWPERDRLVLSNGHICPVLYAAMAHSGYFPIEELQTLRKFGSRLQGHPHRERLPGLETSSGPLGSGLSQAVGMAIADRIDSPSSDRTIYCLLSDGEHDEGATWEAGMLGGKEKLRNLIAIIDRNNIQIDGFTEQVMPLEPIADKWRAWNWHVIEIDGHNFRAIDGAIREAKAIYEHPTMIVAHTIPGKGVREFERKYEWHGKPPDAKQGKMALDELRTLDGRIRAEHEGSR